MKDYDFRFNEPAEDWQDVERDLALDIPTLDRRYIHNVIQPLDETEFYSD
jgi:hypothetical protein